jgi:hypothetical protein
MTQAETQSTKNPAKTPVEKIFPTLMEGNGRPSSVKEFSQTIPGLRDAYVRKRRVFRAIDRTYLRKHPEARQAFRNLVDYFEANGSESAQYISDLDHASVLLDVSSPSEIISVITDDKRKDELRKRANNKIATTFGIEGKESTKAAKVAGFAQTADKYIDRFLRQGPLEPLSERIGITEEVRRTDDVIDLLAIVFDTSYSERTRFEAKRKLTLMQLAAEMDKRTREFDATNQALAERKRGKEQGDPFVRFLDAHVWTPEKLKGDTGEVIVVSKHSLNTYECIGTEEVPVEQEEEVRRRIANQKPARKGYYLRHTPFQQRSFDDGGENIPASFDSRPRKDFLAGVNKLLRKGKYNPEAAVEDMVGWMFVVRTREDAISLKRRMEGAGKKSGSLALAEETEDTLGGQPYSAKNAGSSTELGQLKYDVLFEGNRMEIVILDYKNYLDYLYKDDVAHEEYELKRLVRSGALKALFPNSIYRVNESDITRIIENQRKLRRLPNSF